MHPAALMRISGFEMIHVDGLSPPDMSIVAERAKKHHGIK